MQLRGQLIVSLYPSDRTLCVSQTLFRCYRDENILHPNHGKVLRCQLSSTSKHLEHWQNAASKITFLNKECEQIHPPPSESGWFITIAAVQHVWIRVNEEVKFKYLETQNLNQNGLQNTFDAIHLHCGSNNNPYIGQFVDALKTVTISGLAVRSLLNPNSEDDGATLPDSLHSCLKPSVVSSPSQSISHYRETIDSVPYIVHVTKHRKGSTQPCVLVMSKCFHVSGFIARRLLHNGSCEACTACLISEIPSTTDVYIGFKECSSTVNSLTY